MKPVFTIQRRGEPESPRRYLILLEHGRLGWAAPGEDFELFDDAREAELFRDTFMGEHADDAVVVRHAIH